MRCAAALLASIALIATPAGAQDVLVGATVIDGTGRSIEDGVVVIDDHRLSCVGTSAECPIPQDAKVHDLAGSFVTPGLVDAHVHFNQTGWLDGRPDGIEDQAVYPYRETVAALRADPGRWHRSYLCSGVTAVFDVGGAPWTVTDLDTKVGARSDRAHVAAAGPLITFADVPQLQSVTGQPTFFPMGSDDEAKSSVARLKALGSAAIKVWFLDPPADQRDTLVARLNLIGALARQADLPLIVHATELRNAKAALRAGAKILVHSVDDEPVDQEFIELLLANDATYSPTLLAGLNWGRALLAVATGERPEIDDPNHCVDATLIERIKNPEALQPALEERTQGRVTPFAMRMLRAGRESAIMAHNLRAVRDAGGHIVMATDAGNPLTLHGSSVYQEMESMQAAGMTPAEIIHSATLAGSETLGLADEIGTLEPGKFADLLVLAEDPRKDIAAFRSLTHVMRAGVLKQQRDLQVR